MYSLEKEELNPQLFLWILLWVSKKGHLLSRERPRGRLKRFQRYLGFICLFFFNFNFIYLFGCTRSQLQHVRSFHCSMQTLQLQHVRSSSLSMDQTHAPASGVWSLSLWTTKHVPKYSFSMLFHLLNYFATLSIHKVNTKHKRKQHSYPVEFSLAHIASVKAQHSG